MDPSDPNQIPDDGGGGGGEEKRALRILTRCGCGIILSLGLSVFFSLALVLAAIGIGNLTAKSPVSVPAICRIVSSSVDIRSSKVCELGLLNYRAKNVLYPLGKGKKRYRCHDDYYWASVFEAVAEAPKEALPLDCRPSFGTAWSTKMKFKVNETYNCRYTLGSRKADICPDNLFNCQSKDPSVTELVRRFFILFMRSVIFDKDSTGLKGVYAVAGTISGVLFGICFVILLKTLQSSVLSLIKRWKARKHQLQSFAVGLRRACLLVAYFCAAAWLMLEYGKMIGLKQFSLKANLAERTV
ncbi:uncharacterized protein LOC109825661 isoform X2 [Asparagus officinalis]|uniref:uncharacterized protein LOC109825661 isoform X2 n=1 Tax=Asparagus officinalis TaxID=4686 RepID=UPI00098E6EA4|nr:uncharacterized protein LOC109825661 isoform X2 [Asparagus officinalis]